jgi:multiple sugar transport system ATP-binding protein
MVAGLEDISSGTMKIGDRVVNTLSPKDRDIAMVFQSYALYPHMSVADNIAYGLKIRRMDKAEIDRRVNKVADMLELGPCWTASPSSCRVASASAWPWAGPSSGSPRCS